MAPQMPAGRVAQLRMAFQLTRARDPRVVWLLLAAFVGPLVVGVLLGVFLGPLWLWIVIGILVGVLAALSLFGARARQSALGQIEGQPGAALAVVQNMRGDWRVTEVVQANPRTQDLVHRVVGKPGVILLGEGDPQRLRPLLAAEQKTVRRAAERDTPVHEVLVGNGPGQIPLRKLQVELMKMARSKGALTTAQVDALDRRLKPLGRAKPPMPQGPMPRNIRRRMR